MSFLPAEIENRLYYNITFALRVMFLAGSFLRTVDA
jgi:hypothetical protein